MNQINLRRAFALSLVSMMLASFLLVSVPIPAAAQEEDPGKIIVDYSHGQYKGAAAYLDNYLVDNLTAKGYEVVFARGGLNDTILSDAEGLVVSAIFQTTNGFLETEFDAIADWFSLGHRFLWVGLDSDFNTTTTGQWILDNMTRILESVGSHVYPEPTAVQDPVSMAGSAYRPIANITSDDPFVADCVENVTKVFVHSPTCVYGSDSSTPGENVSAVALETESIANVYPLLYYSNNATIVDSDLLMPYAHEDGQIGSFVAATLEVNAGLVNKTGVIVVSGGAPIGYYWPMTESSYGGVVNMTGMAFVSQTIVFGMTQAQFVPADYTLIFVAIAVVAVVVIIAVVLMKKK